MTTQFTGNTTISNCVCASGLTFNLTDLCVPCPLATYKTNFSLYGCQPCPRFFTTSYNAQSALHGLEWQHQLQQLQLRSYVLQRSGDCLHLRAGQDAPRRNLRQLRHQHLQRLHQIQCLYQLFAKLHNAFQQTFVL
ncbi:hypothetical protein GUITHDRAFT_151457 [Guillardia theta CCMP2712]|uniref:Tyrosine-protein kinase ephrin type A/B receptor-like domain-containing protein n=1 Tax=Guillardia theta (strain CCMP2712) TaxID=905079 RepID=L1JMY1_GUITC|nr:hypothetical protein GUITHDRAFT_151457 [Guillardia theta CCMP2712]EKX49777.1 hypothetical protein GUITHDRAFT_151457 [Guillardia theta CCMP2712]|eukprot:XP_005836757.1 hypothetical protein GUITHDRAFT_151457 [Guillardia theta CCMP2712]